MTGPGGMSVGGLELHQRHKKVSVESRQLSRRVGREDGEDRDEGDGVEGDGVEGVEGEEDGQQTGASSLLPCDKRKLLLRRSSYHLGKCDSRFAQGLGVDWRGRFGPFWWPM
eukprot:g14184.t1